MTIYVLMIFSFGLNNLTLETQDFASLEACNAAKGVVESVINSDQVRGWPTEKTTKVACIEDTKL